MPGHTTLKSRAGEQGFTLIELLIVVLIIAMLAAIALPALTGQRMKAQDTAAKTAARNALVQMESCYVDNQTFAGCETNSAVVALGAGLPSFVVTVVNPQTSYTVAVESKSGNVFTIAHSNVTGAARTCTTAGSYGCPASGTW